MLQRLGDHIASCLARAGDAERRAIEATSDVVRLDNEMLARGWRHLASSYQFVESLERFLLDAQKAKEAQPPAPPNEMESPEFPPPGATLFVPSPPPLLQQRGRLLRRAPSTPRSWQC